MPESTRTRVHEYLSRLLGQTVQVTALRRMGEVHGDASDVKGFGYGKPILVEYVRDGQLHRAVLSTINPGSFGHQHMSDRAADLIWSHAAFGRLDRHTRSLDVGGFQADGSMTSLGKVEEFFLLLEYVQGVEYYKDLNRLRDGGPATDLDRDRADALCDYLVSIHQVRGTDSSLYRRHIRETVGASECIFGLVDNFPLDGRIATAERLAAIERRCVDWRWRLKGRTARLCQRHGDFHPWNILFREGTDFSVLDRSRGEYGEAADDVVSLSMNYLFFALQGTGRVEGPLADLFARFWARYLEGSRDREILEVVAPYVVFRGLVMASPVWYPDLDPAVREGLFRMMENVLEADRFEPEAVGEYLDLG